MKVIGIICEYNPFHNGHQRQLRLLRERFGADTAIVCAMSGDFVQRGEPALYPKELRAEAAIRGGADLVLELPVTVSLRSAEGFAFGGVSLLESLGVCGALSFGCEREGDFMAAARLLLDDALIPPLRAELARGISFPAARQRALESLGGDGALLAEPNCTLGIEYCKALLRLGSAMEPVPILREGSYHAREPEPEQPSASSLRECADFLPFVPEETRGCYAGRAQYRRVCGERAMLARLRAMTEEEFSAVPFGGEGLYRRVWKTCRVCGSVEELIQTAKSKRYPYTRLSRLLLCAYLGISEAALEEDAPYIRVLGFREAGRALLRQSREAGRLTLLQAGQTAPDCPYAELEARAAALYELFRDGPIGLPGEKKRTARVFFQEKL